MTVENSTEIPSPPILYGAHSKPGKAPGRFQNFLGLLVGPMLRTPGLEDGCFFMNHIHGCNWCCVADMEISAIELTLLL